MAQLNISAQKRNTFGRKVKSLRREGLLPANIYGKKTKSLAVQVSTTEFEKLFKQSGKTSVIDLKVEKEKKTRTVLATNLQKDPVTDFPLHVDFHQVDLSQKVTVDIPILLKGESSAVKEKGAVLITLLDKVKVEALPKDLPDEFVVNISSLKEFDDSVQIKDLGVDKAKVTVLAEEDEAIIMVQEPKKEEEPVPVEAEAEAEAEVEAEVEAEEKPTEAEEKVAKEPNSEAKEKPKEKKTAEEKKKPKAKKNK